ncbi:ribonuclease 3-like [Eriocheir sinensis]|uniref:ribonuclease 3-like n=1 Tax=Eriocheir sinensis TaxID=95602 RepID=UPI0021CADA75|nr:ribonuclease 3-like [Eriocheir sinensis]XP_050736666.1 ribonuclease 3-like [Eriocheir sinensis]
MSGGGAGWPGGGTPSGGNGEWYHTDAGSGMDVPPQWASPGCAFYSVDSAPPPVAHPPQQVPWGCPSTTAPPCVRSYDTPSYQPTIAPPGYPPPHYAPVPGVSHDQFSTAPPQPYPDHNAAPPRVRGIRPPGPPGPIQSYAPALPSPVPPSCPPPAPLYAGAAPGYGWGPSPVPPAPQTGVQTLGPPEPQPWPLPEWDQSCVPAHPDHGSRHGFHGSLERGRAPSAKPFRDGRAREHDSAARSDDRPQHAPRYERERRSLEPKYKDGEYLGGEARWGEGSGKHHPASCSSSQYRGEGRRYSPPGRAPRDPPPPRYERERERERDSGEGRYKSERRYAKYSEERWPSRGSGEKRRRGSRSPSPAVRASRDPSERPHSRSAKRCRSPSREPRHSRSLDRKRPQDSRSPESRRLRTPDRASAAKKSVPIPRPLSPEPDLAALITKEELEREGVEEEEEEEEEGKEPWVRSAPADLFYQRDKTNPLVTRATKKLMSLCEVFEEKLVKRASRAKQEKRQKAEKTQQLSGDRNVCSRSKTSCEGGEGMHGDAAKDAEQDTDNDKNKNSASDKSLESSKLAEGPSANSDECNSDSVTPATTKESCNIPESTPDPQPGKPPCKHQHKHRKRKHTKERDKADSHSSSSSSSSGSDDSSSSEEDEESEMDMISKELEKKRSHPDRLHPELWFNDPGEMNDGPLCRCSLKAQRSGIRHGYYVGEGNLKPCDPWTNNADCLHHYLITISPPTNFLIKTPTVILHDKHEFIFEGFSLLSHHPLEEVPTCSVIRFNIEYTILYIQEKIPDNFCIQELNLLYDYLFLELLELVDLNLKAMGDSDGCPRFHFMPRFVRKLPDNGKEILSMNEVLSSLLKNSGPLVQPEDLAQLLSMTQYQWQNYADHLKGMVVTCPGMKPCSIRVDQLDRDQVSDETINYPVIVHFGIRPPQLSYAGNPEYQKAWREYVKFRHLLANMPKPSFDDKRRLAAKENRLQEMRMTSKMKRDVTVAVSSQGFYRTGIMCDVVQHAMLLPVLVCHLRFHQSLEVLEERITYKFQARFLLQLALTHPSYRENFGTNPDHARNSLTNCGIRQPEYGDRRIHYMNTRKRGINTLINIMSRFGRNLETESKITHNERLEFLGDAVVEFLTSIHLFHLFPSLEEGGLATYRAAIVQNQHLAVLAEKLGLDQFMLYAHGSDLCHDFELRHAMANCFEALMGAIFLDSGIEEADKVLSSTLFKKEPVLLNIWVHYPLHPIQEQEPEGDRKWIKSFPILMKLSKFEDSIGVEFKHIRLLARAFTDRSIGFNNLTLGSNQRLEFLGDTVLQLVSSEYLYRYFPEHHEGHLSLLRSSLVNNRTQAVVCDDLGMTSYAMYSHLKTELKTKDRADLLEAFLGALYIDRGLKYCQTFCQVCFFPRLHQFIMNQDWNDPKSKLQQCCLTLRTMGGGEPDIPIYKVIECKGPTNTRVYTVAVYFRGQRLAKASGHSIQQAEMNAAREALMNSKELFPQLDHQRRVIEKSVKIQGISKTNFRVRGKGRGVGRTWRGSWREEERRGDRDRPKEREKQDSRESDRWRDGEKRPVREKQQSTDGPRVTKSWEKEKPWSEKDWERSHADRERQGEFKRGRTDFDDFKRGRAGSVDSKQGRRDSDDSRRGRNDSEDSRRGRSEFEEDRRHRNENESRSFSGSEPRSRGYSRHISKDVPDADKHRERHREHPRSRLSPLPHRDSGAKSGHHVRGDYD